MQIAASNGFFFHLNRGPWKCTKWCYQDKTKRKCCGFIKKIFIYLRL